MTTTSQHTSQHPPGATLHLGGNAWAHPDLSSALYPLPGGAAWIDGNTEVTPYPGNPRRHDQEQLTASIRDMGLYRAVIVQRSTGHVLAGNGTLRAVTDLGGELIPVTWVDVDDTRAAALVARDNLTSDLSVNDDTDLLALLTSDPDVLALSGYVDEDLDDFRRAIANALFAEEAMALTGAEDPPEAGSSIDVDGDVVRVTVTVDTARKADLYALLHQQEWVRDVADAHVRRPA